MAARKLSPGTQNAVSTPCPIKASMSTWPPMRDSSWVMKTPRKRSLSRYRRPLREVEVEKAPRMLDEGILLVSLQPRLDDRVLDAIHAHLPRRVHRDELRHLAEKERPLGAFRQGHGPFVETVVLRQVEARVVELSDVTAIEQHHESLAFRHGGKPAQAAHLDLSLLAHLELLGKRPHG